MALSQVAKMKNEPREQEEYEDDDKMEGGEEDLDNEIAFGLMANTLLQQEGQQGLAEALNQGNPVPVIATMLSSLVAELAKKFESSDMEIDQAVWLAPDGAVERTIDFIDELAGPIGDDAKTAIFSDVVDQIKLFKNQGTPGSGAPAGAPPMPGGSAPMPAPPMSPTMGGM
jgi:hypothetical protein